MAKKLIITIIIIVLIIGGWFLYAYYGQIQQLLNLNESNKMMEETPYDDTSTIEMELDAIPDDSSIDAEMDALDMELQKF